MDASVAAYSTHVAAYEQAHRSKVADLVQRFSDALPAGSIVLDAGCGPGRDLARFAALGHHPTGVDANAAMVAEAQRHGHAKVGDLRALPFVDNTFDGAWACASLVHMDKTEAYIALCELARVVRPRGPVYASVKASGQYGWRDTRHGHRWFNVWAPNAFARVAKTAGLAVESTDLSGEFVNLWARVTA